MLTYNDLYETLRKEKYSEVLQILPKKFLSDFSGYIADIEGISSSNGDLFADSSAKSKKQLENSIAIFKELIRLRKKKLLNLVFVATETGIMKRDYENMLAFEKEMFDLLVKAFENGDKELAKILSSKKDNIDKTRLIMFNQNVDQFVDMSGGMVGPFIAGELVNLDLPVAELFVSGGKASFVDEE